MERVRKSAEVIPITAGKGWRKDAEIRGLLADWLCMVAEDIVRFARFVNAPHRREFIARAIADAIERLGNAAVAARLEPLLRRRVARTCVYSA